MDTYNEIIYNSKIEELLKKELNKSYRKAKKKKDNLKQEETKYKRAKMLTSSYKSRDNRFGQTSTLTPEQLIGLWDNGCYWCGETDWHKLGADRIDNSKPHTIDNVVCACSSCNYKRARSSFEDYSKKVKK